MRRIARLRGVSAGLALIAGVSFLAVSAATAQIITLQKLADYPLPGDMSRYDYLSFDPTSHRMYIAHLGQGEVHVFDTQSKSLVGTVQGIPGVHGVIAVPELGRVYATATNENTLTVIDAETLTIVATVPTGSYPDGLAYAANVGKVYVSNERGGSDTVVDATNNELVATIAVGGEA